MVLRNWTAPVTTQVVGVARTGGLTTTVVNTVTGMTDPAKEPDLEPSAGLLATAVSGLCTLPDAGSCAAAPTLKETSPVPVGRHPSLLVEADLPPVPTIEQPWAGTQPTKAKENVAATRCDDTEFTGPGFTKSLTRTFVIPAATQLPPEFGLSETVGALPPKQAHAFVSEIRDKLTKCPDDDLGTDVEKLAAEESGRRDLYVWRLTVEVSEERSVRFLMAAIREGGAVAQLTFVPSEDVSIGADPFVTLVHRAQERLRQLAPAGVATTFPRGPGPTDVRRLVPSPWPPSCSPRAAAPSGPPPHPRPGPRRLPDAARRRRRRCPRRRPTPTPPLARCQASRWTSATTRRTATTARRCVVTAEPATRAFRSAGGRCGTRRPAVDVIGVEFRGEAEWFRGRTLVLYPSTRPRAARSTPRATRSRAAHGDTGRPRVGTEHTLVDYVAGDQSIGWIDTTGAPASATAPTPA